MGQPRAAQPWVRFTSPSSAPSVLRTLKRRRFRTLKDCRAAWDHQRDPLAICVAVTKAPLDAWLVDAILLLLYAGTTRPTPSGRTLLERAWAARAQDEIDANRAWEVVRARTHPKARLTWETVCQLAAYLVARDRGDQTVTPAAMKKSYGLVRKRLRARGRYYWADREFQTRLAAVRFPKPSKE
jgi:hypothetical protein